MSNVINVNYDGTNFIIQHNGKIKTAPFQYSDLNIREANVNTIKDFNQLFRRRDIEKDAKEPPSVKNINQMMNSMFSNIAMNNPAVGLPNLEKLKKIIKDSAEFVSHSWLKTESLKTRLPIQYAFYETGNHPSDFTMKGSEIIGNFASEVGDPFIRASPKKFWPAAGETIVFDRSVLEIMGVPESNVNKYEATMFAGSPPSFEYKINIMNNLFGATNISRVRGTPGYEYFRGNPQKNKLINENGPNLNAEIIKQFWGKEYGDMMQVMFMLAWKIATDAKDHMFAMVSTDDVVFVTSILLKLPCVYTYYKNELGIQNKDKLYRIQHYQGYNVNPEDRKKRIIDMVENGILENNNNIINTLNTALNMGSITVLLGTNENNIDFSKKLKLKEWFELRIAQINRINLLLTTDGRRVVGNDTQIQEINRAIYLVNEFIVRNNKGFFKIFPGVKTYTKKGETDNKIHFATTFQRAFSSVGGVPSIGVGRTIRSVKSVNKNGKFVNNTAMTKYKQSIKQDYDVPMTINVTKSEKKTPNNLEFSFDNNITFVKKQIAKFCKKKKEDELLKKYESIFLPDYPHNIQNIDTIREDLTDTLYHRLAYYSYLFSWVPYDNFLTKWLEIIYHTPYSETDDNDTVDDDMYKKIEQLFLKEYNESLKLFEPIIHKRKRENSSSTTRKQKTLSRARTQSRTRSK